jgi:hypothetical protein
MTRVGGLFGQLVQTRVVMDMQLHRSSRSALRNNNNIFGRERISKSENLRIPIRQSLKFSFKFSLDWGPINLVQLLQ